MTNAKNPRKAIATPTWKRLFAESGNQCALPDCNTELVTDRDERSYNVAHIHGVNGEAARFRSNLSRDDLAEYDNLLLVCNTHNNYIDAKAHENEYPPSRLRDIKREHIGKVKAALSRAEIPGIWRPISTALPVNFGWVDAMSGLDLREEDDVVEADALHGKLVAYAARLDQLPLPTRKFFAKFLEKARWNEGHSRAAELLYSALALQTGIDDFRGHVALLDQFGLAEEELDEDLNQFKLVSGGGTADAALVTLSESVRAGRTTWKDLITEGDWSSL